MAEKATAQDLIVGANWLRSALDDYNEGEFDDIQASVELCIAFLDAEVERREARSELAASKRAFAAERGIKVSQVRVKKAAA